jgi:predicted NUDIX family NTP pyrophosphohydrolase
MAKTSAGLLMYRVQDGGLEVLLAHPGGPFFRNKDDGAWTLPKGELEPDEAPLDCARREFLEETGVLAEPPFLALGEVRQKGGKTVIAWAFEGVYDAIAPPPSNTFELEWPPRSGRRMAFPEIDRLVFFGLSRAREKINPAQAVLLDRLEAALSGQSDK